MPCWIRAKDQAFVVEVSAVKLTGEKAMHHIVGEPTHDPASEVSLAQFASLDEATKYFNRLLSWINAGAHGVFRFMTRENT